MGWSAERSIAGEWIGIPTTCLYPQFLQTNQRSQIRDAEVYSCKRGGYSLNILTSISLWWKKICLRIWIFSTDRKVYSRQSLPEVIHDNSGTLFWRSVLCIIGPDSCFRRKSIDYLEPKRFCAVRRQLPKAFVFRKKILFRIRGYSIHWTGVNASALCAVLFATGTCRARTDPESFSFFFRCALWRIGAIVCLQVKTSYFRFAVIKQVSGNSVLNKFSKLLMYAADTFRDTISRKGIMITLTGVDGAGKSTIIAELQQLLREKFRKESGGGSSPSIFVPDSECMETWQEKAEQISVSNLPRTGTNRSTVSSVFRFAYYYTDYLFGQFYIYFRYNLRGYTVLYDRYYFDFIVDGRRSNIHLNEKVTRSLYRLLIKPKVNILLFAPVDDILRRKQELNAEAIRDLTNGYRHLLKNSAFTHRKRCMCQLKIQIKTTRCG